MADANIATLGVVIDPSAAKTGAAQIVSVLQSIAGEAGRTADAVAQMATAQATALAAAAAAARSTQSNVASSFQGMANSVGVYQNALNSVSSGGGVSALASDAKAGSASFVGSMNDMTASAFEFNQVLEAGRNAIEIYHATLGNIVETGLDFAKTTESAQVGIAGIILSFDKTGQITNFSDALAASKNTMNDLKTAALQSTLTFETLLDAFNTSSAAAYRANIPLAQQVQLTKNLAQAINTVSGGHQQALIPTEVSEIYSGTFSSRNRAASSLGITKTDLDSAKEAGTLVDYLNSKLAAFNETAAAAVNTWSGLEAKLTDLWQQATGGAMGPAATQIKDIISSISLSLAYLDKQDTLQRIGADVAVVISYFGDLVDWIIKNSAALADLSKMAITVAGAFAGFQAASLVTNGIQSLGSASYLTLLKIGLTEVALAVEAVTSKMIENAQVTANMVGKGVDSTTALQQQFTKVGSTGDRDTLLAKVSDATTSANQERARPGADQDAITQRIDSLNRLKTLLDGLSNDQLNNLSAQSKATAAQIAIEQKRADLIAKNKSDYEKVLSNTSGTDAMAKATAKATSPQDQLNQAQAAFDAAQRDIDSLKAQGAASQLAKGGNPLYPNDPLSVSPDDKTSIDRANQVQDDLKKQADALNDIQAIKTKINSTDEKAMDLALTQAQNLAVLDMKVQQEQALALGTKAGNNQAAAIGKQIQAMQDGGSNTTKKFGPGTGDHVAKDQAALDAAAKQIQANKDQQDSVAALAAEEANRYAALQAQATAIEGNPFLSGTEKNQQIGPVYDNEIASLQALVKLRQQSITDGTLTDQDAQLNAQKEIEGYQKEIVEIQNKNKVLTDQGQIYSSLKTWITQQGTAAQQAAGVITSTLDTSVSSLTTNIQGMINGTESLSQAWEKVGEDIINTLEQVAIKLLITAALTEALNAIPGFSAMAGTIGAVSGAASTFTAGATSATDVDSGAAFVSHTGGIAGQFTNSRPLPRYHSGGIAGDEVPAILQKGEGVFTKDQMKAMGGAGGGGQSQNVSIVNMIQPSDILGVIAANPQIIVNAIGSQKKTVRQLLS